MQPSIEPSIQPASIQPSIQSAQVTLFSASQLQQSVIAMNVDIDAFLLVRVYYFVLSTFSQCFNEFFLFINREMRNLGREWIFLHFL